jgi:hypothetical protein
VTRPYQGISLPKSKYPGNEVVKGVAAESVKGFSLVAENYESVLSTLKERFGHSRLILDAHMRGLIHLPRLSAENATSIRVFYDKVVGNVRSVESMGEKYSSETSAPVLVPLIVDKLPKKLVETCGSLKLEIRKRTVCL